MLEQRSKIFYGRKLSDTFNTLLEIEAHEEDKRDRIISHKKDMKEYICQKVVYNREDLLKSVLVDLDHILKGIPSS
jgi:hypothetical protein